MSDQAARQGVSRGPFGWHYLPEVFLSGLAGAVLWFVFAFPTELEPWWLYAALCVAAPATAAAMLLVGPRRFRDALMAFGIAAIIIAGLVAPGASLLFALLTGVSFASIGLAAGIVAGALVGRVVSYRTSLGRRVQWRRAGGLVGAAGMGFWLVYLTHSAEEPGGPLSTAGLFLFLDSWIIVVPTWLATILMIAFLEHRKHTRG